MHRCVKMLKQVDKLVKERGNSNESIDERKGEEEPGNERGIKNKSVAAWIDSLCWDKREKGWNKVKGT